VRRKAGAATLCLWRTPGCLSTQISNTLQWSCWLWFKVMIGSTVSDSIDSPCVVQDTHVPIPLTHTAGFSNNAHLCRVSAVQKLFDITHDARQAANNWGLECHQDMGKMGMFALCHNLVYACPADIPFVQDPAVCDYRKVCTKSRLCRYKLGN